MKKKKFGFVFISHKAHLHHGAPVAFELSKNSNFEVVIYTSTEHNYKLVESIGNNYPGHHCEIKLLRPSKFYNITRFFKNRMYPGIFEIYRRHYKEFTSCDVLLSPHSNLDFIMDREKGRIKYVKLTHGSGDSSVSYLPAVKRFDFILISGDEVKQRFIDENIIKEENIKVVGYPKFDLININNTNLQHLFKNDNPIFLYNPHHNKHQTSWYKWGYKVLDFFSSHPEYNLIFAPHLKIFGEKIPARMRKYLVYDNILIDTHSDAIIDMSYTKVANVYIGDISSQLYEFLYKPKPCIFLNPHKFNWENNKFFNWWHLGDVVNDISDFETFITNAQINHPKYQELQISVINKKFDITDKPAGQRAAEAISEHFGEN